MHSSSENQYSESTGCGAESGAEPSTGTAPVQTEKEVQAVRDLIVSETEPGVVVLTLNRPRARNALNRDLREALTAEIARLQSDDDVSAIILTGADPAFCAGMDTKELAGDPASIHTIGPRTTPLFESRKPIIGAINGAAMTGGLELALACDWLIASPLATFGDSHTRMGLTPGWGLTVLLTEAVGSRRARQLITTGEPINAETALAWGLVSEVVQHPNLLARATEMAQAVGRNNPLAVATVLGTISAQRAEADNAAWAIEARHWSAEPARQSQAANMSGVRSAQLNEGPAS